MGLCPFLLGLCYQRRLPWALLETPSRIPCQLEHSYAKGSAGGGGRLFLIFFFNDYLSFLFFQDFAARKVRKWEVAVPTLYQHKHLHLLKNARKKNWWESHIAYCS